MAKNNYILYGTLGCHLCEQAQEVLLQAQCVMLIVWRTVDIALDQTLMRKYAMSIPVLVNEQGQALQWPFSLLDIQQLDNP